jgi:hypothetical protein
MPANPKTKRSVKFGAKVRARPSLIACRIPKGYDGGSDDPNDVRLYARKRHLAAAHDPVTGKPDLRYFIEISDLEEVMRTTLLRIYKRDGKKVFGEASRIARDALSGWISAT